jgi:membrane-bound metal-dependent hydrolase YbcI (DUF457 family)
MWAEADAGIMAALRGRPVTAIAAHERRRRLLPRLATVAAIGLVDSLIWRTPMPRMIFALCDEAAHAATAALILSNWRTVRATEPPRDFVAATLAAAVLIDLDHVPHELFGSAVLTEGTNRPYGHTALTVALAAAAAVSQRNGRGRRLASAVGLGVALHLVRDVGTGGAPLLWPLGRRTVSYPYPVYLALLLAAAAAPAVPGRGSRLRVAPAE